MSSRPPPEAGQPYTWRIPGTSAFQTVEDAAGPGGYHATAPFYRIAQGAEWPFYTPP